MSKRTNKRRLPHHVWGLPCGCGLASAAASSSQVFHSQLSTVEPTPLVASSSNVPPPPPPRGLSRLRVERRKPRGDQWWASVAALLPNAELLRLSTLSSE
uniref:Putative secreted protein n=1 Tax=Ixodes ricinus TaxID=34613 RepID=A0A6B0UFV0_IXORI